MTDILKPSVEWHKEDDCIITDPDGWDQKNFDFAWYRERITKEEYEKRKSMSEFVTLR